MVKVTYNDMRHITTILTLLLAIFACSQTKDRRAELHIEGRVNEISVSPDEKIWLVTATGNTYFTDNIDLNWHYGKPLFESTNEFGVGDPNLSRISFFNKDTAIMTGYISFSPKDSQKNGYYLTKDGGKTWALLDFGGDSWIYNTFFDKYGNVWMGGSSGDIYFSKDFGQHWETLNSPYDSSSRMNSIFMTNSLNGISGALDNDIYITTDNWKSYKKIATPFDKKKYVNESDYSDDRIEKIVLWNNMIVVNQNGHIYYTASDKIDWQQFPVKVFDFELDKDSKVLFAVTDSLKISCFTTPTKFHLLTDKKLLSFPIDMKVVNHSLFVVTGGYDVYKINESGLAHAIPYTTDKPIAEPKIVKHGTNLTWGANGKQIYLADNTKDWYRENVLDFDVEDLMLLNDSVAILWDGIKTNYLYSLKDHTSKKYYPESPLKTFLAFPVKMFSINSGSQGCFHSKNNEIKYERVNDSIFAASSFSVNNYQNNKIAPFKNQVNGTILANALMTINANPAEIPSLKDFQISEMDKKNYLALVDKKLASKAYDGFSGKKKINKAFYYSVPSMLDTLNGSIITPVLNQQEGVWSTTSNWFTIQIVNTNNDTLNISRDYYESTLPWNLPWKFVYNGLNFNCYNIEFSRFINYCIPDSFMDKEVFDNRILIMQIADYLYNKEE